MIEQGGIERARKRYNLNLTDRALIATFDVLRPRFGEQIAEERARNLVCGLIYCEGEPPRELVIESLGVIRRHILGPIELADEELEELAREIIEKLAPLKVF